MAVQALQRTVRRRAAVLLIPLSLLVFQFHRYTAAVADRPETE